MVDRCIQLSLRLSQERFNRVETTVSAIIENIERKEIIEALTTQQVNERIKRKEIIDALTAQQVNERIEYQEMIDATIARYKSQQVVNSIVNRIEKNKKIRASYFYM